jgi:hypothetical protein
MPVLSVRDRFRRWTEAAAQGKKLKSSRLRSRDGCYVLFAATAPLDHRLGERGVSAHRPVPQPSFFGAPGVCVQGCALGPTTPASGMAHGSGVGQRFVRIVWDGPEPDWAASRRDGRNTLRTKVLADALRKIGSDNPQMIHLE